MLKLVWVPKAVLALLVGVLIGLTGCNEEKEVPASGSEFKVGIMPYYAPFESLSSQDEIVGFDVELAEAIAQKLNKKLVLERKSFMGLFSSLQNREVDAVISAITATDKREELFSFSQTYYKTSLSLVYLNGEKTEMFDEMKIGASKGTIMEDWIKAKVLPKFPNATFVVLDDNYQLLEELHNKKLDFLILEEVILNNMKDVIEDIDGHYIDEAGTGYAVMIEKSNTQLLSDVNRVMSQLKEEGLLQKLQEKWIKSNIQQYDEAKMKNANDSQQTQEQMPYGQFDHSQGQPPINAHNEQGSDSSKVGEVQK